MPDVDLHLKGPKVKGDVDVSVPKVEGDLKGPSVDVEVPDVDLECADAKSKGYKVFILGIGNTSGAPIPLGDGEYLKDNSGNVVMTALNEQMCRDIANAGSGTYIHVDNTSMAQERLNDELAKMQKGDMQSVVYEEYDEQYQAFGILALVLLAIEVLISEAVNPWMRKIKLFKDRRNEIHS
jgi:Ca-activated chloride channel family protein